MTSYIFIWMLSFAHLLTPKFVLTAGRAATSRALLCISDPRCNLSGGHSPIQGSKLSNQYVYGVSITYETHHRKWQSDIQLTTTCTKWVPNCRWHFQIYFLKKIFIILIPTSLKLIAKSPAFNKSWLGPVLLGTKPSSEPMSTQTYFQNIYVYIQLLLSVLSIV